MVSLELKRVVVTGLGVISPLGNTVTEYWEQLLQGHSGISLITSFDASRHATRIAGEVKNFDPCNYMESKEAKRLERFIQFAVCASKQAIADAGFEINNHNSQQVGVLIGSGIGGLKMIENQTEVVLNRGPNRCSPFLIPMMIADMAAGVTAIHLGAKGPNSCPVTACASGANAIGDAFRTIQRGDAQVMICGGTEAAITPVCMAGFSSAKALSTYNEEPTKASRPFSKDRDGFVMGEGSGILLLEELSHAQRRGARIYAEIVGYGLTCDAHHITSPPSNGEGATRAMELSLKNAGLYPNEVDYINAHGTSTPTNDVVETLAIKKALGDHAFKVAISSTKSMTGHLLGASGGIEAVATVMAIAQDKIPPTINLETPDPACDLDYVPLHYRSQRVDVALSNSFGFGGHNVSLAFKKFEE
ncbi:beta-ketoacyl-ACP synthase II [Aetokthonos hydrillicola Thurmond2011]|jgi:3-oxoacyl-[acyl-carrier-protein] synthase II|uniref:3-oxoacyl-[acyl-carrier-protein] synthase 2 n=1 Tax=Aetokthonos hydrillicola Thurmond2011 TaxID=2712845 RepID=A0AAP5MAP0_9CYAN|nr:beta-ketoacyl-ACP synthase II [Aetokthonos hydrillicola]MBO3459183.1 beta-ketoacyl-ACP synthase II [Aetokthonos hydrillicola CCALA 1050]MBW4584142.1 beta-ketoacyl-ACP synthase II [Aetokthonos hydrillicola CCALA 1050]MDR9898325.1 beta-ketoacyl-ACP synthase II [Aetokthonos hydrillicola Thurmond2011]